VNLEVLGCRKLNYSRMLNKNLLVDIEQGGIKDIRLQGTELF
jgi:hypothetical protein